MSRRKPSALWSSVFFCSLGSVCAGPANPAIAQDADLSIEPGNTDAEPINLFDEDDAALPNGQAVEVGAFGEIDLHVKDLELTKVLQLLSIQSQRNIIASRNVAGTVSADLYDVDFYDALDAILTANGFGYTEKGDFIYVYTAEEIQALEDANRQVITRVYRLNYLNATDASTLVSGMLSDAGSIGVTAAPSAGFQPSLSDGGENSFASEATLVIRDYPEYVDEILLVLDDLDTKPRQVLVESTILQARLTEANAWGVDFSVVADVDLANFASPLGVVDDLLSGSTDGVDSGTAIDSSVGSDTVSSSGFKVGVLGSNASVFVQALDQVTDVSVLARPKMLVLNRQKGELLVGGRVGYLSTTQTETSTTQTVEFLDEGTSLTVRPFISTDDHVRLELRPSLSDASVATVEGQVIPNETVQELVTNIIVKSGQTVVLGGLFKEETSIDRSQVPGAGDIPLLGAALKGQNDLVQRDEVIFMIKPTIMRDSLMADAVNGIEQGIDASRIGMRNALLPWSRSKWTSSLLKQAYQARAEGDDAKATWYTNLVLNNEPTNPEAVQLKAALNGESMLTYDKAILESAMDDAINGAVEINNPIVPGSELEPGTLDDPVFPWSAIDAEPSGVEAVDATEQVEQVDPADEQAAQADTAFAADTAVEPVANTNPADTDIVPTFVEATDAGFAEPAPAKVTQPGISQAEEYVIPAAGITTVDGEVLPAIESFASTPATERQADPETVDPSQAIEQIEESLPVFGQAEEQSADDESWALESTDTTAEFTEESTEEVSEPEFVADSLADEAARRWLSELSEEDISVEQAPGTDEATLDELFDSVGTVTEVETDTAE
ncbi:MAG: hypothetical protein AAF823_12060 [Planctomycetota bacterium]